MCGEEGCKMPHITVQMFRGRDERIKAELSRKLAATTAQVLKVPEQYVSVSIYDIPESEWNKRVYSEIMKDRESLYKVPKYGE